jgi:hypothetical protein
MIVDGRPITIRSEQQQKLYDDIKRGRCTRCHKAGHYRAQCPDKTPQKWEGRFDSQKAQYWVRGPCQMARKSVRRPGRVINTPSLRVP